VLFSARTPLCTALLAVPLVCFSLFLALPTMAQKSSPKPPTKPSLAVKGTSQLPGEWCSLGKTYTFGQGDNAINLTLKSAVYRLEPLQIGRRLVVPKASEKMLVLRYTLQNPNPRDYKVSWATPMSYGWIAVDSKNTNHTAPADAGMEPSGAELDMLLKPGQKVECIRCLLVPAEASVPKLMVQPASGPVARYDLTKFATPLPEAQRDTTDITGFTPTALLQGTAGKPFLNGFQELTLLAAERTDAPFAFDSQTRQMADQKRDLYVISFALKYNGSEASSGWLSDIKAFVTNEDGDRIEQRGYFAHIRRDETFQGTVPPRGDEVRFRLYFIVPKGVPIKTVEIGWRDARKFRFDAAAIPAKP
jgi:hypothetical protein